MKPEGTCQLRVGLCDGLVGAKKELSESTVWIK